MRWKLLGEGGAVQVSPVFLLSPAPQTVMGTALATGSEQSCFGTPAATVGQLAWAA